MSAVVSRIKRGPEGQPSMLAAPHPRSLALPLLLALLAAACGNEKEPSVPEPPANQWSALGSGLSHPVRALTVFRGDLIAGGDFTRAGDTAAVCVARWDGASWHPLGAGINPEGPPAWVNCLAAFGADLIAGGEFTRAGDAAALNIARWDGAAWHPLGSGIDGEVRALAVLDGDLVAGGFFSRAGDDEAVGLARWNGSDWSPFPPAGIEGIRALTVFGTDLIAAGSSGTGSWAVHSVMQWDGAGWQILGAHMDGEIHALGTHDGGIIAGGVFSLAGGVSARCIAQWDGASWSAMGSGMSESLEDFPQPGVAALSQFGSDLIAGGFFRKAGGGWANCIARWDGASWHAMGGTDLPVLALTTYGNGLIVAGGFKWAGGITVEHIALWGP